MRGMPFSLFGERIGVRGKMRLRWLFRSPYVPCFSIATEPVNVPGRLTATALATRAPGRKIAADAVHSAFSYRLIGDGRRKRPCKVALAAHPCASPRPCGYTSSIFSRTRVSLLNIHHHETPFLLHKAVPELAEKLRMSVLTTRLQKLPYPVRIRISKELLRRRFLNQQSLL